MKTVKHRFWGILISLSLLPLSAHATTFHLDPAHSFIEFKIKHLGYSWLHGRFNALEGEFNYDAEDPTNNRIRIDIDTRSIDTNHAERDKHLNNKDFLNSQQFPKATFVSTQYEGNSDSGTLYGDLTLLGATQSVAIPVKKIGEGADPWGGYRIGFEGSTQITYKDFGISYDLGPASQVVYLELGIEGIRK